MERLGKKRLRFTDAERRKLAVLGKKLGRKALAEVATIATPDTILRWYRELLDSSSAPSAFLYQSIAAAAFSIVNCGVTVA
jgi:hypothetical protein